MRRTRNRRKPTRKPLPMVCWVIAVSCVAAYVFMVFSRQYIAAWAISRQNEALSFRVKELQLEQQRLRRESAQLQTAPGMECEARRLGFLRDGETRLVIPR